MSAESSLSQELIDEFVGNAHGNFARVKELLARQPALANARARWGESALEAAAQTGRADIAQYLLDAGAPLDICTAAMLGRADYVAAELERDPGLARATGAHGIPLMHYPIVRGNIPLAELLLRRGVDLNAGAGSNTALHGAAWFNQAAAAEWLLAHGAQVDARDYEGRTPLDRAREQGHDEVVAALLRHGATGGAQA